MAYPDWQAIFTARPDLNPPGYDQLIDEMRNNPWRNPKRRVSRTKDTRGRYTGLKHSAD